MVWVKTTTVKSIMGILSVIAGNIKFEEKTISNLPSFRVAKYGIGLVPEGRQIFPNLTVRENLIATAVPATNKGDGWSLERSH